MNPHTLRLTSNGRVDRARRETKYDATCSCGKWSARNLTAQQARGEHAVHLQAVAGPDAQDARERAL